MKGEIRELPVPTIAAFGRLPNGKLKCFFCFAVINGGIWSRALHGETCVQCLTKVELLNNEQPQTW